MSPLVPTSPPLMKTWSSDHMIIQTIHDRPMSLTVGLFVQNKTQTIRNAKSANPIICNR